MRLTRGRTERPREPSLQLGIGLSLIHIYMDGLRLSFEDDTWLLVRPSGTEPVVRVYAEGFSVEERDESVSYTHL